MADRLPVTLQAYRRLAEAAAPLAPMLLSRRLRKGKEHPVRLAERLGDSVLERPPDGCSFSVNGACGVSVVISSNVNTVICRRPGVTGLYFLIGIRTLRPLPTRPRGSPEVFRRTSE